MPEGLTEADLRSYEEEMGRLSEYEELAPPLTACIEEIRRCWSVIEALNTENGQMRLAIQQHGPPTGLMTRDQLKANAGVKVTEITES